DLNAHRPFHDFEMLRVSAETGSRWVSISGEPVFDERGRFAGYRGVGREITERKHAQQMLRDLTDRLRIGQATARMIVMDWDIAGDRLDWSDSPEWLRGPLPASGRYPFWKDQVHPEDRERFLAIRARSIESMQGQMQEYRIVRTDGEILWLRSHQKVLAGADGKAARMIVAMLDITERKAAEQRLELSEARLARAQRIAQIGSWELDLERNRLIWSDEAYRIFEIERSSFGASYEAFLELVHPEERAAVNRAYAASLATREPYAIVHRLCMADGRTKYVEERCETEFAADGTPLRSRGTVQDITHRRNFEQALKDSVSRLRRLSRQLRSVEERERRAVARELHDRIGQNLSTLDLMLGMLGQQLSCGKAADASEPLAEMRQLLRNCIGHARDLMTELRPPALEEFGLHAALKDLAADTARKTRVAVQLEGVYPEPRPPIAAELALYRIAQEALNNVVRHAQASRVQLQLAARDGLIELAVSDDGVGFDPEEKRADPSWGLTTMRERAEEAGIAFTLESAPGRGTRVILTLKPEDA
ncbi:MAG: PAS domain S-box protein, partial [Betaproteobacteria bacterium]